MMASSQVKDSTDQSPKTADALHVQTTIDARMESSVIAPVLASNTFNAPVNLNIYSDTKHTEQNTGGNEHGRSVLRSILLKHKTRLRKKFQFICEGDSKIEHKTLFNRIYTGLVITQTRRSREDECEHEVHLVERKSCARFLHPTYIKCSDIFKGIPEWNTYGDLTRFDEEEDIRTVLTKGIAGIGKTMSVQKFILEWAEGKANHDIDLMLVMPFRELNVVESDQFSLSKLIGIFNPELKDLATDMYEVCKTVFILDGLDEFNRPLNFQQKLVPDITEASPVDTLITNLIKGTLFPSSYIWITSRPAAADQIPSLFVSRVTEVQGFCDSQKEEYFRKKIRDENQANRIISHIKTSRSLHAMCHIPVFCWIVATLFQQILKDGGDADIPNSLTELYSHFLYIQSTIKNEKYDREKIRDPDKVMRSNKKMILKLAKLAYTQLIKGRVLFDEEDLNECDINVTEVSLHSGFCTEIFKQESVLYQRKIYCFVHLSFQEFLAAFHVFHCYLNKNIEELCFFNELGDQVKDNTTTKVNILTKNISWDELLKIAVDKTLQTQNGHLDLFLRFLLGMSLESNQRFFKGLLTITESNISVQKTKKYIREKIRGEGYGGMSRIWSQKIKADSSVNLYLCLTEMNDKSLHREIQDFIKSKKYSEESLSPSHCSAIAYMLQTSEEILAEFDLRKYNTSEEGLRRLVPAASNCRKALLTSCCLNEQSCKTLAALLETGTSPLKELDLSFNNLQDSGMKLLSAGLKSTKLEILRLAGCNLTGQSCETVASTLPSLVTSLKELDLCYNDLQDTGVNMLCAGLESSPSKLKILRLAVCNLTQQSCETVGSLLLNSSLKELELSNNDLYDSGIKVLAAGLEDSSCKLEILRLSGCLITEEGCCALASALCSNPAYLRQLDLSYNHPGDKGVNMLSARVMEPQCKLDELNIDYCGALRIKPGFRKYACEVTLDPNTAHKHLSLSEGNRRATCFKEQRSYPDHPERFDGRFQVMCGESLLERCYWEVERNGDVDVAVSYKEIKRKGHSRRCRFGYNDKSWRISCYNDQYSASYDDKTIDILGPSSSRVGVYLDRQAGILSFYSISDSNTLSPIHTFHSTFTNGLYAGFGFNFESTLYLCQIE